jgi:competence protein ComEC
MQHRLPAGLSQSDVSIEGRVLGLPQREDDSIRFDFHIEAGAPGAPIGQTVRLGWYGHPPVIEPGSEWRLRVRLKRPRGVLNAGGFDFEESALSQRLAATGYVHDPFYSRRLERGSGVDAWRDRLSADIDRALGENRARFVKALATGDTRGLSDQDWETLRATGLTHQIAISGPHVGMVAGLGALLVLGFYRLAPSLGRRWPRPQAAGAGALLFAFGYTALAGFALPTVRTLLMIAVVVVARWQRRAQSGPQAIALALIAILLVDPLSVLAPGFWLSFLGVGWLLWCLPHETESSALRTFLDAQGVAVLGLLPLTVWFFGQASIIGPLANLIGIPVIGLGVVPLALLGLLVFPVSPWAAAGVWKLSAGLMAALWWCLERMAHWPWAIAWLPEPSLSALLLALIGVFWLLLPRGVPGKPLAMLLLLPLLWPRIERPAVGETEITVIDVGQGLSVLVRTHGHALLFDTGPHAPRGLDLGEAAVVPALRAAGVGHLDVLIVSHGDNDHSGGMQAVQRAFEPLPTYAPDGWLATGVRSCRRGQHWRWDGVDFRLLHPPGDYPYLRNDSSCVLRVEAGGHAALLPGDIGRWVERRLVREQGQLLRADLLLVPHHGSGSSSSQPFIDAVAPGWAVFSTGAGNRFGLPHPDTVERYRESGARLLDTATSGELNFRVGPAGTRLLSARRQDHRRYWQQ